MSTALVKKPAIWLFVCPNVDGFHPKGDYVEYLMVHGLRLQKVNNTKGETENVYTYGFVYSSHEFIMVDDPSDALVTAITGALVDCPVLRVARVCIHCHARGIRGR